MVLLGLICMLVPAAAGGWLVWANRNVVVRVHVAENVVWTGHLYAVVVTGALLACWFVLGAAFIQCRIAERRRTRGRAARRSQPASARRPRIAARRGPGDVAGFV
jgi:hypothetical protein